MKRSTRCDYALRAVLELSHYYNNKLIRVSDLSKAQDIPNKYLEQIMLQLKKAGYVESRKGPSGGYALAKPPDEIFLGDIIRLVDKRWFSPEHSDPLTHLQSVGEGRLHFFGVWAEVQEAIAKVLDAISMQDILRREAKVSSRNKQGFIYYI